MDVLQRLRMFLTHWGSARVYKPAWEDEKIFALFKEERGKQFDPKLIDIFFEHLDEFLEIREKMKD